MMRGVPGSGFIDLLSLILILLHGVRILSLSLRLDWRLVTLVIVALCRLTYGVLLLGLGC